MTITITQLPAQNTVLDNTLFAVETAGITGHTSAGNLKSYLSSGTLTSVTASSGSFSNLSITNGLTLGSLTTSGDVIIGGNLTILGTELAFGTISGNLSGNTSGNISGNLTGNITGNLIGSVYGNVIGNLTAYVSYPNQPYITTLGNIILNNLTANANVTVGGDLSVTGDVAIIGNTTVTGAILPVSNIAAVNIGSTGVWFNNIYGTAVHALYADLAERYTSDSQYIPGTVVIFGSTTEVTASYQPNDIRVAGVVSTNPAYTMNAGSDGVDVALQGRVPCQVTGTVNRGDLMVTSPIPGVAMANNTPAIGSVIGKALGTHSGSGVGVIEVVVGRL